MRGASHAALGSPRRVTPRRRGHSVVQVLPKRGILSKKGGSGAATQHKRQWGGLRIHRRNWKDRYFVIDPTGCIKYYHASSEEEAGAKPIAALSLAGARVEPLDNKKHPHAFRITFDQAAAAAARAEFGGGSGGGNAGVDGGGGPGSLLFPASSVEGSSTQQQI